MQRVGPYQLERQIGRGGLGVVYRARDERSGASVALKLLSQPAADAVAARRLAREFNALSVIAHPNVVRVLDAGVHEDTPFLVMEHVDGLPLRAWMELETASDEPTEPVSVPTAEALPSWLDDEPDSLPARRRPPAAQQLPPVTPERLLALSDPGRTRRLRTALAQVSDGLAFIHARGLIHRDVKPSNVLIDDSGRAKLVDFGLVKIAARTGHTTAAGQVVGTYRYMSPEQAKGGAIDSRSDLYALGAVLYELLTDRPPHEDTRTVQLLEAIVHGEVVPLEKANPHADRTLGALAMGLLQKHPDRRPQTAEEVAALLRAGC